MSRTQAEYEAREEEIRFWRKEWRAAKKAGLWRIASECEAALGRIGYVGPETEWDYETEGGAL